MRKFAKGICIIFLITLATGGVTAQRKGVEFLQVYQDGKSVVDLTETVARECTESKRTSIGDVFIELKYQQQFSSDAERLFTELKSTIKRTLTLAPSLPTKEVRFYLLRMPDPPKSFKVRLQTSSDPFIYAEVMNMTDALDLNCKELSDICHNLYKTIPHELVHPLLEKLITHKKTRWFEDGLAEYIGREVLWASQPKVSFRKSEMSAKALLHQPRIRRVIFNWREFYFSDISGHEENWHLLDAQLYDASQLLIRLMLDESVEKGVEDPLSALLARISVVAKKQKMPLNRDGLMTVIRDVLKVDVRTLGTLDTERQRKLIQEAIETLTDMENPPDPQDEFYAVNVLANIDEIPLTDEWVESLLKRAYSNAQYDYTATMAATALARRNDKAALEKAFNKLQKADPSFERMKFRSVLKYVRRRSIDSSL